MEPRATPGSPCCDGQSVRLQCMGCATKATIDLRGYSASSASSGCVGATYADADIVVWDCPACGQANADELQVPARGA